MDTEYGLIVAFPDGSPSFVHGFEAGMIWQRMRAGEEEIEGTYHAENLEVFRRMAEAEGYTMETTPTDYAGWADVSFLAKPPKEPKPKLRLIEGGLASQQKEKG